ncbi:DBH-like monooxygenase protein 2 homolog [Lampris incognitus]|uniref:DBH-like monooxygenase protein 2 homolog n=1 Tax=Lampris incognitus TaxID=2546036 RepID=UPI0024B53CF4|nr:DBH-like monooxygenase protein 2 homolog [Lampris incognitus]XP_056150520.1 DBH-like monooxygenase protein 2 homolog [Lampris incognitus]
MYTMLLFLSVLLAWPTAAGAHKDTEMPFMEYLDPNQQVKLKWGFSEIQGNITFELSINTTGWVGFGFSPNGGMAGSDIVIGGTGPNGNYFNDYHATGNNFPLVDKQQSYNLLSLTEVEGQTTMTFWRSVRLCDEEDFHITSRPVKLIYAYGTTDDISYHTTRRGTKEVNLLNYMPRVNIPERHYFNFTMDNVDIPAVHTYYHCKVMKLPKLNGKHQIYRIEPSIEHVDIVHHMLLYSCPSSVSEAYNRQCNKGGDEDLCIRVVATWGVGGGAFEFPENAGISIAGENADVFYRLEIHYNNPTSKAGRRDSSGLKLYYTAKLRQHDVNILMTGLLVAPYPHYQIPPGTAQFHTYGVCHTTAFSKFVEEPVPDLQVFAVSMHTHLAGRRVRVGHFRNGTQIDFMSLDENYNFEMQQITALGSIKTLKQGDELLVECTYNTTSRTGFTKMGFATTDEMCLAFLFYYPAIDISTCVSHPNMEYVKTQLTKQDNHVLESISLSKPSDQDAITDYEKLLTTVPQQSLINGFPAPPPVDLNSMIRNMMETPSVICQNDPVISRAAPKQLSTCWDVTLAGGIMLLWKAVL